MATESSKTAADRLWDFISSLLNGGAPWFNDNQEWVRRCDANLAALRTSNIEQGSTPLWLLAFAELLLDPSPLEKEEWWNKNSGPASLLGAARRMVARHRQGVGRPDPLTDVPTAVSETRARSVLTSHQLTHTDRTLYNGYAAAAVAPTVDANERTWRLVQSYFLNGNLDWQVRLRQTLHTLRQIVEQGMKPLWQHVRTALLTYPSLLEDGTWWDTHSGPRYDSRPGSGSSFPREDAAGIGFFIGFLGGKVVLWYDGRSVCMLMRLMTHLGEIFAFDGEWAGGRIQSGSRLTMAHRSSRSQARSSTSTRP